MLFFPVCPHFSPFDSFQFVLSDSHANLPHLYGSSIGPSVAKDHIMRRSTQRDRTTALPMNMIHGNGLVHSARYR